MNASKVPKNVKKSGKKLPRGGSRKGSPNKITKALKDMILGALDDAGGQRYLARQAEENPGAFLALIGKVLPTTLVGATGGAIEINATLIPAKDLTDAELAAELAEYGIKPA